MSDLDQNQDEDFVKIKRSRSSRRQTVQPKKICAKEERNASIRKITNILQKSENERSLEESQLLRDCSDTVEEIHSRWKKRDEAKRRLEEFEDSSEILQKKCEILAQAIAQSQHLVIYTGAGISTAACIPDYRGTDGIWTRLQQGKAIGNHDLTLAEPTYTHMALAELYRRNIVKYVVSQNCDGLHLRAGLPKTALSELHGNMYVEVCKPCGREYLRLFDVTENTARYSHKTMRKCYGCNGPLVDSIVHFGERGSLQWPLNWSGACKNAKKATTIICLGSSLKVLKKYPWLWQMDKPAKRRPNLYIVNLQWTPKDDCATIKLHGKCDRVMRAVMELLGIEVPRYERDKDPIFAHATELCELECHTTSQPFLKNEKLEEDCKDDSIGDVDLTSNCDRDGKGIVEVKKEQTPSLFSIEKILEKPESRAVEEAPNLYQTFLTYYQISNNFLHHQQQLFGCPDLLYYPFQTSFMYSGLHSIIKNEQATSRSTATEIERQFDCKFCCKNFDSDTCLFYRKYEPVFQKEEFRYSKLEDVNKPNICICCDYTTDEEAEGDVKTNESGVEEEQKGKAQAGWFGKGYRKNRRFRKRQALLPT